MMIPTTLTDAGPKRRIAKEAKIQSTPTTIHAHHQRPISRPAAGDVALVVALVVVGVVSALGGGAGGVLV
jgi:hypothetical protein